LKNKVDILLVDDRPDGIVALEAILNGSGYNLVVANSGREALAKVLAFDFAVILMDVQMPDMDGFETVALIKRREKSRDIPIIFITAINKAESYVSTGYSVGAVDYIFKPFDPHILKSKVAVFVDLHLKNRLLREQSEALREAERRDRMRALAELELEGFRRYRNLADAIPQIIFRGSQVGVIDYFNQFWFHYTASTPDETMGVGWRQTVHPKNLSEIESKWREAEKDRKGFECECRFRHAQSGEYRWQLLRVVPEFNKLAELTGWIGAATDIHDQKKIQDELRLAKKLADAASETKSRFLANMSHEIRTPLGVILGFSELLISPQSNSGEKEEAVTVMKRNSQQLLKIIDDILDLSKVEAGKLDIERSEISIIELISTVRNSLAVTAKQKGLDFRVVIDGKIPQRIMSNSTRIQQILLNIIGNALKFTSQGEVVVRVSLRPPSEKADGSSSRLHFSVTDSGPGLTKVQIENLFQPFTQGDSSITRKFGGTGLGLVLSRKLARSLGGDVWATASAPNKGAHFEITVETGPLDGIEFTSNLDTSQLSAPVVSEKKPEALSGMKVLLVEDSVDIQIWVSHLLTVEGAQVNLANNGVEGVEMAMRGSYDVILMDIQMPVLDGLAAITQLRSQGFKKPIIALTAHGMVEDRKRCLAAGSDEHVVKPVDRAHLIESISRLSTHFLNA
jgi:two-component system, sensor histidine kinase